MIGALPFVHPGRRRRTNMSAGRSGAGESLQPVRRPRHYYDFRVAALAPATRHAAATARTITTGPVGVRRLSTPPVPALAGAGATVALGAAGATVAAGTAAVGAGVAAFGVAVAVGAA